MTHRCWSVALSVALALLVVSGCGDEPTGVGGATGVEAAVILNSVDNSLTVFPVDTPSKVRTIGLGPAGSPVSLAVRKNLAAVPLGLFPAVAIVDLSTGTVKSVALPDKSGATGVAFASDSIVYVGNPNRNSVSAVNVVRATLGPEITVGLYPQSLIGSRNRVYVLDSELDSTFQPVRPGRITLIADGAVIDSTVMSGLNPGGAAFAPNGVLYVVSSGSFGAGNGSLSVVNPSPLKEIASYSGFGDFPLAIAFSPAGLAFVGSFSYGIAVWDPSTKGFVHSPSVPLAIQGAPQSSSGVAFDSEGRLYTLIPNCSAPGSVVRLTPALTVDRTVTVGTCPFGIGFTRLTL